jgi:hypothetical protein
VYLTIFAGRQRYMEILQVYIDSLFQKESIHQVHFWIFTKVHDDSVYIENIAKNASRYKVFTPGREYTQYDAYYEYYLNSTEYDDNDILLKCDDDIVFIDVHKFDEYVYMIKENGLYFPNIVNNDVGAYFQNKFHVHKYVFTAKDIMHINSTKSLSNWHKHKYQAMYVHSLFLENHHKFSIPRREPVRYHGRISINFFGATFGVAKKYLRAFFTYGAHDDEPFLTHTVYNYISNYSNFIKLNFNVVHFAFGQQRNEEMDLFLLPMYKEFAKSFLHL